MSRFRPCLLCGTTDSATEAAMVEWAEPIGSTIWARLDRCTDRAACRQRLEAGGHPWEVRDAAIATPGEPLISRAHREVFAAGAAWRAERFDKPMQPAATPDVHAVDLAEVFG